MNSELLEALKCTGERKKHQQGYPSGSNRTVPASGM